ncbi:MAG: DUF2163 domain-containing protein [Sphingomicrobium sp.]
MHPMLEGPLTSLAFCWRVERRDGAGFGLTSHDSDLRIGAVDYSAEPGMLPAAIQRQLGLKPSDGEIGGAIHSQALAETDLVGGRWDGARVTLSAVDWENPDADPLLLMAGEMGEVRIEDGSYKSELTGTAAKLQRAVCPETSPECRAELGDKRCRVDMAGRVTGCTVTAVDGGGLVVDQLVGDDLLWGRARFLSGENSGLASVVIAVAGNRIELRDTPRAVVAAGDRIELREGCDKRFATCCDRFGNAENFRGEPHLPGNDLLTRYPGA